MKTLGFIKTCQFLLLILSLFLALKYNILLAFSVWTLSIILGYKIPKKYQTSFMSHKKGLFFPLWTENIIDLVITVRVILDDKTLIIWV